MLGIRHSTLPGCADVPQRPGSWARPTVLFGASRHRLLGNAWEHGPARIAEAFPSQLGPLIEFEQRLIFFKDLRS
jgi:hypothetical protein